jgi:hypothetical protein
MRRAMYIFGWTILYTLSFGVRVMWETKTFDLKHIWSTSYIFGTMRHIQKERKHENRSRD